jgi:hypothetical protein
MLHQSAVNGSFQFGAGALVHGLLRRVFGL